MINFSCGHRDHEMIATRQISLIGVVETYRCTDCGHLSEVRSWAEAEDTGFAPENEEDDWAVDV